MLAVRAARVKSCCLRNRGPVIAFSGTIAGGWPSCRALLAAPRNRAPGVAMKCRRAQCGTPQGLARGALSPTAFNDEAAFMADQTYDDGRARNLEALLKALAERIQELDAKGELLRNAGELTKLIGDVRSELFHYEVRATYDSPEIAESRRIVRDAEQRDGGSWEPTEWTPEDEDDRTW